MICSEIWHKYHKWYFKIILLYTISQALGERNLRQFWNITGGISAKYHVQIILLFVYSTTRKGFVIFTSRYFKLSWNTTVLSQSNGRNFSCSSINKLISIMILVTLILTFSYLKHSMGSWWLGVSISGVLSSVVVAKFKHS